jgi:hypothetical protein
MKKTKARKGFKVLHSGATSKRGRSSGFVGSGKFHEIRTTPHGLKGPPRKKPLPPWREIRDKV